jgi:hypothetical protein
MDSQHDQPEDDIVPSRRRFVGTVAAGIAAAPALVPGAANAQSAAQNATPASRPLTPPDYPKPPFQRQQQDWPALASKMTPR